MLPWSPSTHKHTPYPIIPSQVIQQYDLMTMRGSCISSSSSSSSSSPLLSLVQVPAKLAINLSIHTQHTYDNGVDRTGDRVFRKYSFLHEEREEEKKNFNPQTMLHLEYW